MQLADKAQKKALQEHVLGSQVELWLAHSSLPAPRDCPGDGENPPLLRLDEDIVASNKDTQSLFKVS
jgi:hypothetical protein